MQDIYLAQTAYKAQPSQLIGDLRPLPRHRHHDKMLARLALHEPARASFARRSAARLRAWKLAIRPV